MTKLEWPKLMAVAVALAAVSPVCGGEFDAERIHNWHQWRGPNADGISPHGDPPIEWSETTNVRWKVACPGKGSATPIVWNDRIYVLTAVPAVPAGADAARRQAAQPERSAESGAQRPPRGRPGRGGGAGGGGGRGAAPSGPQQFTVVCFDRGTGRIVWQRVCAEEVPHEGHHQTNTFASGSAITDGRHVFASFGSRGIYCLDMDGRIQWKRDLGDMRTRNGFGEGSTPALDGDNLVVTWDHEGQSFITVLDAGTGQPRWKADRDELTTWATPLIVEHNGRQQVVTNGTNRVRSYDLETGELIWECGGQASNPIASPVTLDGIVYCTTGHRGNAVFALPLAASGDITGTGTVAWHRNDTGSYIASPVVYRGLLYVTKGRDATLYCLDARSGEPLAGPERLPGLSTLYASPVAAADRIYYVDRSGTTVVLRHGPELDVLATNSLDEGIDASPVVVGRQMFLRGEQHLYCLENGE
ncbi:MAG TPA: PQQ-binding-like beta-propeller repeat protein [Planctomycetaceae bacterium]|nr:PQQ-binding-like beta-propeller repeat protein [Planctomycetaceae bacterium]